MILHYWHSKHCILQSVLVYIDDYIQLLVLLFLVTLII